MQRGITRLALLIVSAIILLAVYYLIVGLKNYSLRNLTELQKLPDSEKQQISSSFDEKLKEFEVIETINPKIIFPKNINSAQVSKYYKLDNYLFALIRQSSMNFDVGVPKNFTITFTGVLISDNQQKWFELIEINDKGISGNIRNNPYELWSVNGKMYLSIVDHTGAGSGEGVMKLFESQNGFDWVQAGCFYYNPDIGATQDYQEQERLDPGLFPNCSNVILK